MSSSGVSLELDEGFFQDPHGVYEALRGEPGVRKVSLPQGLRMWLVTGYADARAALADPRLRKDSATVHSLVERHLPPGVPTIRFTADLSSHLLNTDPPDHTRLRRLVSKAFTARGVERMRPRIAEIAAGLLDSVAARADADGVVDLIAEFAFPLPMTVICELLGVPAADQRSFGAWSSVLVSARPPEELRAAAEPMAAYMVGLIAAKRAEPGDDLLTALIEASEDGDRLTEPELVSMAFLLLVAGHETTVNLIANGVLALLANPGQRAALRADPALLPAAVEEVLRHSSPINLATLRYTAEPVEIAGTTIPAGEFVAVAIGAANRDPDRHTDPDVFDLRRVDQAHLAFGHGVHHCVGAPLARLEGEIALGALLDRFPDLAVAVDRDALRWRQSTLVHGVEALPVRLS